MSLSSPMTENRASASGPDYADPPAAITAPDNASHDEVGITRKSA
jgi:hypothetical protein